MFVRDVAGGPCSFGGVCVDYSAVLSNYLSGLMQFEVADGFGRFSVINSTDPGQCVSLMFFCHKFVACVFIHLIFHFLNFYIIVMFLMTI